MLQPIWAMIKPFGFAVLWIWHPGEVSALSGWFDAAFSLINSGCAFTSDAKSSVTRRSCMSVTPAASQVTAADMPEANRFVLHVMPRGLGNNPTLRVFAVQRPYQADLCSNR